MNGPVRLCCVQLFRCTGCYCPGAIDAHRVITHSSDSLSSSSGPSVCHGHQFFVRARVCLVWSYFPCGWQTVQYPGHGRYISCRRSPGFSIIRYRESMWVAMMTDSELFLQNRLQTVSVFQGSDKTHVDQYTDHRAQGPEGICRAIHHRQLWHVSSWLSVFMSRKILRLFNKVHSEDLSCIVQHMGTVKMFPLWLS